MTGDKVCVTLTDTYGGRLSASTKLSAAVKILSVLARIYPESASSLEISKETGINASKIRKILSMLSQSQIVESSMGHKGGFVLKKKTADIHLQEIYCSIEDRQAFYLDVVKTNGDKNQNELRFSSFFEGLFADIQLEIENKMKQIRLDTVMDFVLNKKK